MEEIKSVVVGDGTVGKTCLLISFTSDKYDETYIPTIFDTYTVNIMVDSKPYGIGLWDTAGQEEYDRLRPLSYPATDVFLICFSVSNRTSFNNVKTKWIPEIEHYIPPGCARILVGTKADLREQDESDPNKVDIVPFEEAHKLAMDSKFDGYFECSAKTGNGVKNVFDNAIRSAIWKKQKLLEDGRRKPWYSRCITS